MKASHLLLDEGQIEPVVVTCGDPGRAERIAALLDGARRVGSNREYLTFVGAFDGQPLTVVSHGVGAAGAAICFEELIGLGAKTIIRLGTCGSFTHRLSQGDQLVVTAAVRQDGVTPQMIPLGYPAVASVDVSAALQIACKAAKVEYGCGLVLSTDLFYAGLLPVPYTMYAEAGVLGVEMECSALFVIASLRGVRSGALLTVDGNPLREGDYAPHGDRVRQGSARMLEIGLGAAAAIARDMS